MKHLTILLFISLSFVNINAFASVDESQVDLYYANGIGMELDEDAAGDLWEDRVESLKKSNPEKLKNTTAKISYNSSTLFGVEDFMEALLQYAVGQGVSEITWGVAVLFNHNEYVEWAVNQVNRLSETLNIVDLTNHVNAYKNSIESGRGVVVVAHSQGNFFTNKAYQLLTPWMRSYFQMIGVASPASRVAGDGARVSFDNDPVAWLAPLSNRIENPNRAQPDIPSGDFHSFAYYMGEPVLESNPPISTNVARALIENAILNGVDAHHSAESQWKKVNDVGCFCSEKRITIAHKFDSNLDSRMAGQAVYAFDDDAKVYPVSGEHVFAQLGGSVLESGVGDVCYVLRDEALVELGSILGASDLSGAPSGLFTAQLRWEQPDVRLRMSNSLMGNSASGCGVTALGSGDKTLFSVYPGTYPVTVTAQGYEYLQDKFFSDLIQLNVSVPGKTSQSEFLVTNANQYSSLGRGGAVADILITRPKPNRPPKVEFIPSLPTVGDSTNGGYGYSRPYSGESFGGGTGGFGGSSGWGWRSYYGGGSSGLLQTINSAPNNNFELCTWKNKIGSCGNTQRCLPCEFDILHYLNQAKLGPISGGRIILYKATEAHKVDKEILFEGLTTVSNEINKAGIILLPVPRPGDLPQTTEEVRLMSSILNYEGDFVLELSGGLDIDRNDDLVVDNQFTPVNGKLRLILSKQSLLNNDFKLNILTEIAYQLTKDLLGDNYDKARVQSRLDDVAKRVLVDKLYPDAEQPLGRNDLFYWVPAAHKNWLLKDYDSWLEPMVDKVYLGQDLYTDAYEFVYGKAISETVPLLQSQWFPVSEDVASGTVVGNIKLIHVGGSDITSYVLLNDDDDDDEPSTRFSIDALGKVTLKPDTTLDYETDKIYQLQLKAVNSFGESKPVTLVILVTNVLDSIEDTGFSGGLIPESASAGDVIGTIHFNDAGQPIDRIEVGGADAAWFSVDTDGSIRLTELATLDYETKRTAKITVQAFNSLGSSRVISLNFEIADTADDAPMVKHLEVSLLEGAVAGDEVGRMIIESNQPLQSVLLSGSGSDNFTIDVEGVIKVADRAVLDYELRINYVLSVTATDVLGVSRSGSLWIKMVDVYDVPKLKRTVLRVLENSAVDTVVGTVTVSNAGQSPTTQFRLSGDGNAHFAIDAAGKITLLTNSLSRTEQPFFNLMAVASNAQGDSLPVFVVVYIDTQRPILGVLRSYAFENAAPETVVGKIPLASTGADITAVRIEGDDSDKFNVDLSLNVTVANGAEFDFETQKEYVFTVVATNTFGESDSVPLYIQVADVEDSIRIKGASFSVNEDSLPLANVGQVSILGLGGRTLSHFEITGAGSEFFSIDNTGAIRLTEGANLNRSLTSSYHLSVVAMDSLGEPSNTATLDVFITDSLNTVPLLTNISLSLMDTHTVGSLVGGVNIVSPVTVVEQVWLEGAGNEYFAIDNHGFISLVKPLDFQVTRRYELTVYAKNAVGISLPSGLNVKVTTGGLNAPLLQSITLSLMDTQAIDTVVGNVNIVSSAQAVEQVWLEGTGSEYFAIDNEGGISLIKPLNIRTYPHYTLTIYAKNSVGTSLPASLNVEVTTETDVTPPVIELFGLTVWDEETGELLELPAGEAEWPMSKDYLIERIPFATITDNFDEPHEIQWTAKGTVTLIETGEEFLGFGWNLFLEVFLTLPVPAIFVISYTAIDSAGNQAQASQTLKKIDVTPPDIRLMLQPLGRYNSPHYSLIQGDAYNEKATVSDNADDSVELAINIYFTADQAVEELQVATVDTNLIGHYRIEYSATDWSGNVAHKVRHVIVGAYDKGFNLNDTGIVFSGNYPEGNNADCLGEGANGQDCKIGLDTSVGFQFTKLDENGVPLADQTQSYATQPWHCVLDNQTHLMWEVKNDLPRLSSLHSVNDLFTWYDAEDALLYESLNPRPNYSSDMYSEYDQIRNGFCTGYDTNDAGSYCNTGAFIQRVNASNSGQGLCGFSDWRLPKVTELQSIVHYGQHNPAIDERYFPNNEWDTFYAGRAGFYWSSQRYFLTVWGVSFTTGNIVQKLAIPFEERAGIEHTRLVRSTQ